MIPVLFEIGPIKVYSFGLMMGIAFILANYFFTREIKRRGMPEQMAGTITLIALIAGVAGSKLFSLLENWSAFVDDPMGEIFSASGLTFYGGLILATLCIFLYIRRKGFPFMRVADSAAPSLILAYGVGRIGCHLSGDGDYGLPSNLPWAMQYTKGTVSTVVDPELAERLGVGVNKGLAEIYRKMYPDAPLPTDIAVHPTPMYEFIAALAIFLILWKLRTRPAAAGTLFAIYLICAGIERLLVEFIRLNDLYMGLSQAQWISVGMIVGGAMMLYALRGKPHDVPAPMVRKSSQRSKR